MPLLPASTPTVTSSTASQTYDGWFLYDLHTTGNDPNNVNASVTVRKARQTPEGTIEYSPLGEMQSITLTNLLGNPDPLVRAAVQAVMQAVYSQAQQQGVVL
jgi:hypothetical protein